MADVDTWEDGDLEEEIVTKEDEAEAESTGLIPKGKYLCQCVDSKRKEQTYCYAANLKWKIVETVELGGKKPEPHEKLALAGRFFFDDVNMYSASEKEGSKKRRVFVAKKTGIMANGQIPPDAWKTGIIGQYAIVTVEHQEGNDKVVVDGKTEWKPNGKFYTNVPFAGYEEVNQDNPGVTPEPKDEFGDL